MKKIVSLVLVLILVFGVLSVAAYAYNEDLFPKFKRITIGSTLKTISVGKTRQLDGKYYPDDLEIVEEEWISSNYDVVYVDDYGEIEGVAPGTATITYKITFNNRTKTKDENSEVLTTTKSTTVDITVPGKGSNSSSEEDSSSSSSTSSSSTTAVNPATGGSKIATSTVTDKVKEAVKANVTTSVTFKEVGSVSSETLQAAAQAAKAGNGTVLLNFDTMNGNKVEGRVTVNPANAANLKDDISLGVYTNEGQTQKVKDKFNKYFDNNVVVVKATQTGNYGMSVIYAVKASAELQKSKDLRLYSYDLTTNKYVEVKKANMRIDANNYAHFTTNLGDYLVLCDGPIKKK